MREYTSDQYRYTDDQTSDSMSSVHLQVMIDEIIKNQDTPDKRYRDKYIVIDNEDLRISSKPLHPEEKQSKDSAAVYIANDANVKIDATKEVEQVLLDAVYPISFDRICALLPHLTEEAIRKVVIFDDIVIARI